MPAPALRADEPASPIQCDPGLRQLLRTRLQAFDARSLQDPGLRRAAVVLVVVDEQEGADIPGLPRHHIPSPRAALLLTRRAASLRHHAGQWALPGGRIDAGETAQAAAQRELAEEIGLVLGPAALLGRLDDYVTRSGFVITPWVLWGGCGVVLQANPAEVASMHRLPVDELLRGDAPLLDHLPGAAQPVLRMPVGQTWIAAPTAALLYQFREVCLLGRPTRVAHFDQPRFAWR